MKCKDCTIYTCSHRTSDAEKQCYFENVTQRVTYDFDWQFFRANAVKDILCAMLNTRYYDNVQRKQGCVEEAIYFADELIRQLKEKEEK